MITYVQVGSNAEISNEWSSIDEYSLKIITYQSWKYGLWRVNSALSCSGLSLKCDVNTTEPCRISLVAKTTVEKAVSVDVPSGETAVELNLNFESVETVNRIDVRGQSYNDNFTPVIYIDNIRIEKV